jgi:hypothetical protein
MYGLYWTDTNQNKILKIIFSVSLPIKRAIKTENSQIFSEMKQAPTWVHFKQVKKKEKLSRYIPWRRMGGEEVQLLLILKPRH